MSFIRLRIVLVTRYSNHPVNLNSQRHLLVVAQLRFCSEILEEKFVNWRLKVVYQFYEKRSRTKVDGRLSIFIVVIIYIEIPNGSLEVFDVLLIFLQE